MRYWTLTQIQSPVWLDLLQTTFLVILVSLSAYALTIQTFFSPQNGLYGHLQIPAHKSANTRREAFDQKLLENIDMLPNNDGEFVRLDFFWRSVKRLRAIYLILALGTAISQIPYNYLSWNQVIAPSSRPTLYLTAGAGAVQVLLSILYTYTTNIERHTTLTYHLFSISSFQLLHAYLSTFGSSLAGMIDTDVTRIEGVYVVLVLLQTIAVALVPCEPDRRADLKIVYNKAVETALRNQEAIGLANQMTLDEQINMHSQYSACILSRVSFAWVTPVLRRIAKCEQIDVQDLPGLSHSIRSQTVIQQVMRYRYSRISPDWWGSTLAFLWEVWYPQWRTALLGATLSCGSMPLWYIPHIAMQRVLVTLEQGHSHTGAIAWALVLVTSRMASTVLDLIVANLTRTYSPQRILAHTRYIIYSKVLTRNLYATDQSGSDGKSSISPRSKADELNLLTVDAEAVSKIGFTLLKLFRCQLELLLGASYIWILLGPSGLWGLSTLLLTVVPAYFLTKLQYKLFEKRLAVSDKKVSLMQELIQAISMVKINNAEKFWYDRIKKVRDLEFRRLIEARLLGFVSGMLYSAAPTIIVVVAFAHYTLIAKKPLTAAIAFTSIAVFDQLRPALLGLPEKIAQILQEFLSAKRIGKFINVGDVEYMRDRYADYAPSTSTHPLHIKGTIAWHKDKVSADDDISEGVELLINSAPPSFQLQDLDITFPRGQINLVAGKFGSGKTLLLLAMLGEAHLVDGSISYCASDMMSSSEMTEGWDLFPSGTAYVPQVAWLQSQSIRDNILFGLPLDMDRYRSVIYAVGLLPDLEILEDSDLTEIGERGKILSGGQKARVSLARAMYSRASTILLDDVISAVDAHTSTHIIKHCFQGPLMAGRTIIIASHAVESLAPISHQAIFLEDGRVAWKGTGVDLLGSEYMAHLRTRPTSDSKDANETSDLVKRRPSVEEDMETFEVKEALARTPRQLVIEETRSKGSVQTKYQWENVWFNGGILFYALLFLLLLACTLFPVAERRGLELWTHEGADPAHSADRVIFWVALYAILSGATILFDSLFGVARFIGAIRATKRVHSEMLSTVLCAKMSFFTKTRAGSIIQRFGTDLTDVLKISEKMGEIGQVGLHIIVALVSVTVYGGWLFIFVTALVFGVLYKPMQWYKAASLQNRRLDSVLPGPCNSIYAETIAGTAVIRAFGVQSIMVNDLLRTLNLKITTWGWRMYVARWLDTQVQSLDVSIIACALYLILATPDMSAASAGFILAFAGTISANATWLMMLIRDFELASVSLERTSEYRHLEKEDPKQRLDDESQDFSTSILEQYQHWPSTGKLEVKDLSARYGPDMPDILHKVSFSVESGERVGICGATGGGKSTLAKAFFSFVDISNGQILIDGKDISTIPLGKVRSELGIIAQDPILLSGTLRLNLDIESKYTDDQLYDALHQVQLIRKKRTPPTSGSQSPTDKTSHDDAEAGDSSSSSATLLCEAVDMTNMFANLDYVIASGGENLSAGQKQLVVLARALLKKQKILILDEASASLDSETDAEISRVVHEEFRGATILIIAHRLRTIIPCSQILVLDKGVLVQQGPAYDLIRQDGKFKDLCWAAGKGEYEELVALAELQARNSQLVDVSE